MRALRGIVAAGRCWRWWAAAALFEFALALPAALLWQQWLSGALGNRFEPGELFANLSTQFRFDERAQLGQLGAGASLWLAIAALCAMLAGAWFAGGWAQLAFDERGESVLARANAGARRFFWRYVRVWLLTLVLLAAWSWLLFDWPWKTVVLGWILHLPEASDRLEAFTSEKSAVALRIVQDSLYGLGVALCLCCADYARLRIAARDSRSALAGWNGAIRMVARSPLRTLAPLVALFLVELLVLAIAGWVSSALEGRLDTNRAGLPSVTLLAATTASVLALRCWLRGARYQSAAEVVREKESASGS
jgi:hypothetical protein